MKRMVLFIACLAMLLAASGAYALSFSENYPLYKVESFSPIGYCYLYDQPSSITGTNLGRFNNGAFVKVVDPNCDNGYAYVVCTNGKSGYMHNDNITPYAQTLGRKFYRVNSSQPNGYCYMYDKPSSIDGVNQGRYNNGTLLQIVDWDADQNYAKVRIWNDGKYGYIQKSQLVPAGN